MGKAFQIQNKMVLFNSVFFLSALFVCWKSSKNPKSLYRINSSSAGYILQTQRKKRVSLVTGALRIKIATMGIFQPIKANEIPFVSPSHGP